MDRIYDIVIIGLGPAGAVLARLLDKRLSVAAIDKKSTSDDSFRKPCGGLLAPDAQKAVARLGLSLPKEILVDPQIFSVDTIDLPSRLQRHYQRFYINMDRHKFDLWLMSLIPQNVDVISPAECVSIEHGNGVYEVRYRKDGKQKSILAKHIAGADGANSLVRRFVYPNIKPRRYTSIQQWFHDANAKPSYSCVFDNAITDCYSWGVSKDGYFILGGAFPAKNSRERFEELKRKLAEYGFVFGEPVKTEACLVMLPKLADIQTGRGGVFLLGEAAGFISPSSLEGISWALESAIALAGALNGRGNSPNGRYRAATLKLRLKLVLKTVKALFLYTPFLRYLLMKSGIQEIEVTK